MTATVARIEGWYMRTAARVLARRLVRMQNSTPLISFSFDDFPRSALHTGGAILLSYGIHGSFYASLGLMNQTGPTGEMFTRTDLELLLDQGHELGCHTFAHLNATTTPAEDFEQSIIENARALHRIEPAACFKTLSYPIGSPRPATKRIAAKYFIACRGGGQSYNCGTIDLNFVSAFFLEQSGNDTQVIVENINHTCADNGWLVFATHDICCNPTRFGCTPGLFESVVRTAKESGAEIVPVAVACERLGLLRCSEDSSVAS